MGTMKDRLDHCSAQRNKYSAEFKDIFGVDLNEFYDGLFGLDVLTFDTWLKTPRNISTYDHVINVYGERARDIIADLL